MFFATESKLLKLCVVCIIILFNNTLIENMQDFTLFFERLLKRKQRNYGTGKRFS